MEASVYKIFATPKGSTGTGFLVSGRRTVVTNFHVIEKNTEFMVIYRDGKDVQVAAARVIAYKPNLDLAVLRVDRDLPGTPSRSAISSPTSSPMSSPSASRQPPTMPSKAGRSPSRSCCGA